MEASGRRNLGEQTAREVGNISCPEIIARIGPEHIQRLLLSIIVRLNAAQRVEASLPPALSGDTQENTRA
jgi:hypothetical protein